MNKKYIKNPDVIYCLLTALFILIYGGFMLWCSMHTEALVPDEKWFLKIIKNDVRLDSIKSLIYTPNYLGYGSIYWILMGILGNFRMMRLVSGIALISILACLILTLKLWKVEKKVVFYSTAIYLSAPLTWFTGKMIGPEILGYATGVWGGYFVLRSCENCTSGKRSAILGWILLGISIGIKLNYICLAAFSGIYILLDSFYQKEIKPETIKTLLKRIAYAALGSLAGFVISSPIFILNTKQYFEELGGVYSDFSLKYLDNVLNRTWIEWDLVNSGGMTNTIISIWAFFAIFILGLKFSKKKISVYSACISSIFLILISCKSRFLGWYLLPIIFLSSLSVSNSRWMILIICINLCCMHTNIEYQIKSKIEQIQNVESIDAIENVIHIYNEKYPNYEPYYLVETCIDQLPFNYKTVDDIIKSSNNKIIYISQRARANGGIENIYMMGKEERNRYRILEDNINSTNISIIIYEGNENY